MNDNIGKMVREIIDTVKAQDGIRIGFLRDDDGVYCAFNRNNRRFLFNDSELTLLEAFRNWCPTLPNDDYPMIIAPF